MTEQQAFDHLTTCESTVSCVECERADDVCSMYHLCDYDCYDGCTVRPNQNMSMLGGEA